MIQIQSFADLTGHLSQLKQQKKAVFINPVDENSVLAIQHAVYSGIIQAILLGDKKELAEKFGLTKQKSSTIKIVDQPDPKTAAVYAVKLVKTGKADIIVKGMVNTDDVLRAVLDKTKGIVPFGNVVTFVAAMQIPSYHKLLFICDPAVIPAPNLRQFIAMIEHSTELIRKTGIDTPKVALLHATEKLNPKLRFMPEYAEILEMYHKNQFSQAIIDGPLDVFLAVDKVMGGIKEIDTPILGDADLLIFPGIESGNTFYKCLMTFAGAQMGGVLFGTDKPVVLTSRSDSAASKFNSIALACLL